MNCPKCNKPNREKAVFCKWCGTNVVTKATEPLRELVGMETVKNQLQDLVNTCESLALRAQRSGISIRLGMDMIITGNTGTGKTKLAGVLQKLLYSSGIIKKPAMKVVDAVDYEEFAKEWEKNTADLKGGISGTMIRSSFFPGFHRPLKSFWYPILMCAIALSITSI